MPQTFEDWASLLAFRDRLLAEVEAGRLKRSDYRRRLKRACRQYEADSLARQNHDAIIAREKTKAAGAGA